MTPPGGRGRPPGRPGRREGRFAPRRVAPGHASDPEGARGGFELQPPTPVGQPAEGRSGGKAGSQLKRLEEEERELARRQRTIRVGLRLSVIGVVVLALFSMMLFRLWSLQVLHSSSAKESVFSTTTRSVPIPPPRGVIEARGGQVLVSNRVEPVVTLNRQVASTHPAVVRRLAVALGMSLSAVKAAINDQQNSVYAPAPIEVGVPSSVVVYLVEHHSLFPGVTVSDVAEPQYPYGDLASQTLGFVGDITAAELKKLKHKGYSQADVVGQSGIEASYEQYLHGTEGSRKLLVNASGVPVGTKSVTPAKPGDDVVLNIDVALQRKAQSELQSQIASLQAQGLPAASGAVVVEDPRNGHILAMASAPTYNPAWWVGGMTEKHYKELTSAASNYPMLNRATQGLYTPGSTFKVNTATAALDYHVRIPPYGPLTPSTMVTDPGHFTIPGCNGPSCTFQDDASIACGSCNIVTAIAMSDDVFFYTLGYWFYSQPGLYGPDPIQKIAARYGVGQPTGIDLPGAYSGQVDGPKLRQRQHREAPKAFPSTYYGPGDAVNTAFGQGETLLTPLQLANEYATFANGGTRYAPEVAAAVVSPTGKLVKRIKPKVMAHVPLPASTRQPMLQGFEEEITSPIGTGNLPATLTHYPYSKFPLAGKTGTSQVSPNSNVQPDSLYVAFGPVSHPRYVISCVIPNAGYGATASAPVVFRLFEYLIHHPVGPVRLRAPSAAG